MQNRLVIASLVVAMSMVLLGARTDAQSSIPEVLSPTPLAVFNLKTNPAVLKCLQNGGATPFAQVSVVQNAPNDDLALLIRNVKPGLAFDLFTVQGSLFLANGSVDPNFKTNVGLSWYQSDIQADNHGDALVVIRSIFVNQIFGFDPKTGLAPTNTFHVGFWFNDPADAAACGFTGFTPFNGEHHAGPVAMISVPNATTGLGPLCLNPNTTTHPATCNP